MNIDPRFALALLPSLLLLLIGGWNGSIAPWAMFLLFIALLAGLLWAGNRDRMIPEPIVGPPPEDVESAKRTLDALPAPLLLLNARRRVVVANATAQSVLGNTLVDRDLALAMRHPEALDAANQVIRGHAEQAEAVVTLSGKTRRHYQVEVLALPEDSPWPAKAIFALHDISTLFEAEEIHAAFVANVSHELRSPLSSLVGFIETLRTTAKDDEEARERFLEIMSEEAARMTRLINDLLSLSRVEAKEHIRPSDPVDMMAVIEKVKKAVASRAEARSIALDLQLGTHLPYIEGDEDQLTEVMHNLIDNAIKYGREDSIVDVTMELMEDLPGTPGAHILISVGNQGEGVAPEHIPRLTERFYRVDKGRSRAMGGTGLGLAIVKHIVNRHRGRLTISSDLGKGSVFTVLLPVEAETGAS